jgi:hypothetical protein
MYEGALKGIYGVTLSGVRPSIQTFDDHGNFTQTDSTHGPAQVCLGLGDADGTMVQLEEGYRSRAVRMMIIGDSLFRTRIRCALSGSDGARGPAD